MGTLWIIHGFGMGYCFPYQTHTWHCLHSVVTLLSYAMELLRIWQQSINTPWDLLWEWYGSAPYQYHMISGPSLWKYYVFSNNPYNSQIIQAYWPMIWEWYSKLLYTLHIMCWYAAPDMGMIWRFTQFLFNPYSQLWCFLLLGDIQFIY